MCVSTRPFVAIHGLICEAFRTPSCYQSWSCSLRRVTHTHNGRILEGLPSYCPPRRLLPTMKSCSTWLHSLRRRLVFREPPLPLATPTILKLWPTRISFCLGRRPHSPCCLGGLAPCLSLCPKIEIGSTKASRLLNC